MSNIYDDVYSTTVRLKVTDKQLIDKLINRLIRERALSPFLCNLLTAYYYDTDVRLGVDTFIQARENAKVDSLISRVSANMRLTESTYADEADVRVAAKRALDVAGQGLSACEIESSSVPSELDAFAVEGSGLAQIIGSLVRQVTELAGVVKDLQTNMPVTSASKPLEHPSSASLISNTLVTFGNKPSESLSPVFPEDSAGVVAGAAVAETDEPVSVSSHGVCEGSIKQESESGANSLLKFLTVGL